jgi:hypothetical protein
MGWSIVIVGAVVFTVIVVVTTVFGPCPVADEELQVASEGKPVQVKLIAVVKLLEAMIPMVVLPMPPGALIVTFPKPETPVNPGVIVNVTGAALPLLLKLLSPA